MEENLFKKYKEFFNTEIEEFPIFEQFLYKKPTCSHAFIEGRERMLVGSVWEFVFSGIYGEKRKLLEFALDAGFGERNSLGFGFMNIKK